MRKKTAKTVRGGKRTMKECGSNLNGLENNAKEVSWQNIQQYGRVVRNRWDVIETWTYWDNREPARGARGVRGVRGSRGHKKELDVKKIKIN